VGLKARHGSSETDISTLMFYVSCDKYLKDTGKLSFVITQSVFMSDAAKGFRKFKLPDQTPLKIVRVHDMVSLKVFEGATNRPSVFTIKKGEKTTYPVPYIYWKPKNKSVDLSQESSLQKVKSNIQLASLSARPINDNDFQSPWLFGNEKIFKVLDKAIGESEYTGHVGVHTGGANAIFWVTIIKEIDKNNILVQNFTKGSKKEVTLVTNKIEKDFVFPYLRGRDITRWNSSPSLYIVAAQDPNKQSSGISENILKVKYPNTHSYFKQFEDFLLNRVHYKKYLKGTPFYSLYDIKSYTYKKYKVVWRYIASELTCCVISQTQDQYLGRKLVLPDNKLILVACDNEKEAHYLCALLNSSISRLIVDRYVVSTQIAPHILKNIKIPKYSSENNIHVQLSSLSEKCHEAKANGDVATLNELETELDTLAAKIWDISKEELKKIQDTFKELQKPKQGNEKETKKIKKIKKDDAGIKLIQDKVPTSALMHLSHKAKYNDILTSKQRGALFKISRLKLRGYNLSENQVNYLERIIKEAIDEGIIEAKCNHYDCEICTKLKDIFKK
jgi:hypothetical protein